VTGDDDMGPKLLAAALAQGAKPPPPAGRDNGEAFGAIFEKAPRKKAARPGRTRPRGFAPYRPQAPALALIEAVRTVLGDYRDHLPMTLRQVFYRLVSAEVIGKTENDYGRMCEIVGRARRSRLIDMSVFRDDGFRQRPPPGYEDEDALLRLFRQDIETFTLDRQIGQPRRIVLWCEAAGMVPQLERVAHEYSVPVASSSGFDSITAKHAQAKEIAGSGFPTTVLHIGDHDPSGVHVFGSLDEDVRAFANAYAGDCSFTRLAVTPEQVEEHGLPKAPPKETDNRSFEGMTTQAEALDPKTLAGIVRAAIEKRQDGETRRAVIASEAGGRKRLRELLGIGS